MRISVGRNKTQRLQSDSAASINKKRSEGASKKPVISRSRRTNYAGHKVVAALSLSTLAILGCSSAIANSIYPVLKDKESDESDSEESTK